VWKSFYSSYLAENKNILIFTYDVDNTKNVKLQTIHCKMHIWQTLIWWWLCRWLRSNLQFTRLSQEFQQFYDVRGVRWRSWQMISFRLISIFICHPFDFKLLSVRNICIRSTSNSPSVFGGELFLLSDGFNFGTIIDFEANNWAWLVLIICFSFFGFFYFLIREGLIFYLCL